MIDQLNPIQKLRHLKSDYKFMNNFSHFKKSRRKGIIKGFFYSLLVIVLIYVSFSDVLASRIFPLDSEITLQSNQHSNEKLDLFFNPIRAIIILSSGYGILCAWLQIKYQCKEYFILGDFVDSLDKEKIANNHEIFTQDVNNALIKLNIKKHSNLAEDIEALLDGSLNKEIAESYQSYIVSSTLLTAFPVIIIIKIIGS